MRAIIITTLFIFYSCSQSSKECDCKDETMLKWCIGASKVFKRDIDHDRITIYLGNIPNIEYQKYRYVLRTYDEKLRPFRVADGFNNYHDLIKNKDTLGIDVHCYKKFVDVIILDQYGENFYEEVESRVKNDFKGMTEREITEMYYKDYPVKEK